MAVVPDDLIVDDEDWGIIGRYNWKVDRHGYLFRWATVAEMRDQSLSSRHISLHRQLMGLPKGKQVDHINGNRRDNRRSNLRIVTHRQNTQNVKTRAASGQRGVYRSKNKWLVYVQKDKKNHYFGSYDSLLVAKATAIEALKIMFPDSYVEQRSA